MAGTAGCLMRERIPISRLKRSVRSVVVFAGGVQHLEREVAVLAGVARAEHLAHAPRADQGVDPVAVGEDLPEPLRRIGGRPFPGVAGRPSGPGAGRG